MYKNPPLNGIANSGRSSTTDEARFAARKLPIASPQRKEPKDDDTKSQPLSTKPDSTKLSLATVTIPDAAEQLPTPPPSREASATPSHAPEQTPKTPKFEPRKDEPRPETASKPVTAPDSNSSESTASAPEIRDPIRQFGILVPPALRVSRTSFQKAVSECLVPLASVEREMQTLEIEIRRTRKKLRKAANSVGVGM